MLKVEHEFDNLQDLNGKKIVVAAEYATEEDYLDHKAQMDRAGQHGAEFGRICKEIMNSDRKSSC